jgi:hypothetical protein
MRGPPADRPDWPSSVHLLHGAAPVRAGTAGPSGPAHRDGDPRYERQMAGELIHIDAKKLGRIQPGRGQRVQAEG